MTIYFDMDGTLANFYGVNGWLDDLKNFRTRPYELAEPLFDALKMFTLIQALKSKGYHIGVISWCSKSGTPAFDAQVDAVKREWLAKYFPYAEEIHVVKYGTPKQEVATAKTAILVDDEDKNLDAWNLGDAINAMDMMEELWGLV